MMEARFEDKFPLTNDEVGLFRYWLTSVDGAQFRTAFPNRIVNSIYFDSPELDSYLDNVEGAGSRRKVRLRWYGETFEPQWLRFEVKIRSAGCGTKRLYELDGSRLPLEPYRSLASRLRRTLPSELRIDLDESPVAYLISRYRREYYVTSSGIRLTVDSRMGSRRLIGSRFVMPRMLSSSITTVVELKYAVDNAQTARRALSGFPLSPGKNSKYAQAVESWV